MWWWSPLGLLGWGVPSLPQKRNSGSSSGQNNVMVTTKQIHTSKKYVRLFFEDAFRPPRLFRDFCRPCAISLTGSLTEEKPLCGAGLLPPSSKRKDIITLLVLCKLWCFFFTAVLCFQYLPAALALAHRDPIIVIDKYHLRLVHFLCTNQEVSTSSSTNHNHQLYQQYQQRRELQRMYQMCQTVLSP